MSVWQTPHATRRTSTSPGPGSARSISCTARGAPNSSRTAARILMARQPTYPAPLMPDTVSPDIFKAYDIRGVHPDQMDEDVAEQIGRAFARVLSGMSGKPVADLRIGLGRDMRLQAPAMAARYGAGMVAEGAHVVDAGMVGTEMLYWLVGARGLDGGLMCTASHNPARYTGAKMVERGSVALSSDRGLGEVRAHIESGLGDAPGGGSCEDVDLYAEFQETALQVIDASAIEPLKVVLDGGNGMAGPMIGPILSKLPLELIETYWVPDGE